MSDENHHELWCALKMQICKNLIYVFFCILVAINYWFLCINNKIVTIQIYIVYYKQKTIKHL